MSIGIPQLEDKNWFIKQDLRIGGKLRTLLSTADVSAAPTDAELVSAFGTAASVGSGFVAVLDDNGADTTMFVIASNGTSYFHLAMTKAV